jgi:hypothetical protein
MPHINVNEIEWKQYIGSMQDAVIFHHPVWVGLLTVCYGYETHYLSIKNGHGQIIGGLPLLKINSWLTGRRATSLPFTDFCRPLLNDVDYSHQLLQSLQAWRKENRNLPLEIRWPLPQSDVVFAGSSYASHLTPLDADSDKVYRGFKKKSVQASIVQASKAGIDIKKDSSWNGMRIFYMLHCQTRQRHGTPVQPLRFFKLLWESIISKDMGFILLAYKDKLPIAGGIFLHWNKTLIYKYGASDTEHWKLRPNNLLLWEAIRWGCENGYKNFDWGKTELENEGLRNFKRHWGTKEQILHYSVISDQSPKNLTKGRLHKGLAKVIQRSPVFVCKTVGELLYRHFG